MEPLKGKSGKPQAKRAVAAAPTELFYGTAADIFTGASGMMIAQTRRGFPATVVADVARTLDMPQDQFYTAVGLPRSTMKSRIAQGKPLSPSEGDRVYRVTKVLQRAVDVLEDRDAAKQWVQRTNRSLGNVAPLTLLDTEAGYELVMDTLGRIEHGIAA